MLEMLIIVFRVQNIFAVFICIVTALLAIIGVSALDSFVVLRFF